MTGLFGSVTAEFGNVTGHFGQEPLRLLDEQQFRVMPLAVPSERTVSRTREFGAVALFEARARAVDPHFLLNDERLGLVIEICRQLDGLPFYIDNIFYR